MKRLMLAAAAAAMIGSAGLAKAVAITPIVLLPGENNLKFENFENAFDAAGNVIPPSAGAINLVNGGYVAGIFRVTSNQVNPDINESQGAGPELTGIFVFRVVIPGTSGLPVTFTDGGAAGGVTLGGAHFDMQAGEAFRFFRDGSNDWDPSGSLSAAVGRAQNGSLYLSATTTGGYAYATTTTITSTTITTFEGLNAVINNTGLGFNKVNDPSEHVFGDPPGPALLTDAYAESKVNLNPFGSWLLQSSDPAFVSAVGPVPAVLPAGGALLGLVAVARRRRTTTEA